MYDVMLVIISLDVCIRPYGVSRFLIKKWRNLDVKCVDDFRGWLVYKRMIPWET